MKTLFLSIFLAISLSGNSQYLAVIARSDTAMTVVGETKDLGANPKDSLNISEQKAKKGTVSFNTNFSSAANSSKQVFEEPFLNDEFSSGYIAMKTTVAGLKEYTVKGLVSSLQEKTTVSFPSFSSKLGALTQLNSILYDHYDGSGQNLTDFDKLVSVLSIENAQTRLGDCQHYAFLTSKIAIEAFNLRAAVLTGFKHELAQVRVPGDSRLVLIDGGEIITEVNGWPLDNKDQVDAAMIVRTNQFTTEDITIDPSRNRVAYINRYNNFAGFFKQLQNWNNTDRQIDFLGGKGLSLFSHINSKGSFYGTMERKSWGLEGYYILNNNQYNGFLKGMQGINIAGQLPFSSKNDKWKETVFFNLGLYRAMLSVQPREAQDGPRQNTYGIQVAVENYLEYSLTPRLSLGAISILNANREIVREGGSLLGELDYRGSISPFVGYRPYDRLKLVAGAEVTNTLALPNIYQPTAILWMQTMYERKNFSSSLRLEYQPASIRVDHIATWKTNFGQIQFRAFAEKYTTEFKETNLYHDALGTEIGLTRRIKSIGDVKISVTGLTDNCGNKNLFLNLGVKF